MKPFEKIEWLAGEPPAVLQGAPVPLKIGIHEDLVKLARSPATEVRKALRHHCSLKPYIAALLVDQAIRYDAAGEPVEPVSEGAQIAAATLLRYRLDTPKKPASAGDETVGVATTSQSGCTLSPSRPNANLPKLTLGGAASRSGGVR